MKVLIIFFSLVIVTSLLQAVDAEQVKTITIPAGQVFVNTFNLEKGEVLTFSLTVSGGNDDINLWVTDPSGFNIIRKQGVIGGWGPEAFEATTNGAYSIHLDNSFSILTSKFVALTYEIEKPFVPQGGGCLIATATYGSELAPQVQQLREIRDNTLLKTKSGSSFMTGFNEFYYSFSPTIADLERQNPVFKEAVKLAITPLITSLSILNYVEIDSDAEMLSYGISLIILNVGMYFVLPAIVIHRIKKFV